METYDFILEKMIPFLLFFGIGIIFLLHFLYNEVYDFTNEIFDFIKEIYRYLLVRQKFSIDVEIINTWEEESSPPSHIPMLLVDPDTGRIKCDFFTVNHFKNMVSWKKIDDKEIVDVEVPYDIFMNCRRICFTNENRIVKLYYEKFAWKDQSILVSVN